MNPIVLIPARLAATRLPGKPMALIAGEPMIVHVWRRAMAAQVGEVVVACDHADIFTAIEKAGGKAVMTDSDAPSGSDRIWQALETIDPTAKHDVIVNVQGDMPTLEPSLITQAVALLFDSSYDIATLCAKITDESEKTDPAVVKAVLSGNNALYFSRATIPHGEGPLYHHIGLYAYRRAALAQFVSLPPSTLEKREKLEQLRALEHGMRIGIAVVDAVPLGVDTPETLEKARRWYEQKTG